MSCFPDKPFKQFHVYISKPMSASNYPGSCDCAICGRRIPTTTFAFQIGNYILCSEECVNMYILSRM